MLVREMYVTFRQEIPKDVNPLRTREYLRILDKEHSKRPARERFRKYYEDAAAISRRISGLPPLQLTKQQESEFKKMFKVRDRDN